MKERPLTIKQRAFIKETLRTKNPAQAVKKVYQLGSKGGKIENRDYVASAIGQENLQKPLIKKELRTLGDYWSDGDVYGDIERLREGKKEVIDKKNEIRELRDNQSISDAVDKISKIKGLYAPEKQITLNLYKDYTLTEINEEIGRINQRLKDTTSPVDERKEGEPI